MWVKEASDFSHDIEVQTQQCVVCVLSIILNFHRKYEEEKEEEEEEEEEEEDF